MNSIVISPVAPSKDGVNIKPEKMEKERLYHCIFNEKALLFFKDDQDILNCYEIEDKDIVNKIKVCKDERDVESVLVEYIEKNNLKN